jgi:hypothetical protein
LFDKADKDAPKDGLDDKTAKSEFEQYYLLKKRSKVPSATRSIYFGDSDANKDKQLSYKETQAHEEMITHFTKTEDKTKGELTLEMEFTQAQVQARLANKLGAL